MPRSPFFGDEVDCAIMNALKRSGKPLRYNQLHRKAGSIFGQRLWIKTFNDHLKKLQEKHLVIRTENNRYNVTYELAENYSYVWDQIRKEYSDKILDAIQTLMYLPGGREYFEELVKEAYRILGEIAEEEEERLRSRIEKT